MCLFLFIVLCLDCSRVFSAWVSVPKAGSTSLVLHPWLPWAVPGVRARSPQHLSPVDVVCTLADPVVLDMENPWPQSCGVCHSPSLAVPSFAWNPGYRERRKEGESVHGCFYPLYSLGSRAAGLVVVAPGEHRGIT